MAGGRTRESAEHYCTAALVFEDENEYDENAVRVDVDGGTVGYLAREDAPVFRDWLAGGYGRDVRRASCPAVVVGGWDRGDGDRGHFGVKLDLPEFYRRTPSRRPPRDSGRPRPARSSSPARSRGRPQGGGVGRVLVWVLAAIGFSFCCLCPAVNVLLSPREVPPVSRPASATTGSTP